MLTVATVASPLSDVLLDHVALYLPLDSSVLDESRTLKAQVGASYWVTDDLGVALDTSGSVTLRVPGVSGGAACFDGTSFLASTTLDVGPRSMPQVTMGGWVRVEDLARASTIQQDDDTRYVHAVAIVPVLRRRVA
jgi:hypothetical protein